MLIFTEMAFARGPETTRFVDFKVKVPFSCCFRGSGL